MLEKVISAFLPVAEHPSLQPIGSGLIHHTWKVEVSGRGDYILQEVNTKVFQRPKAIAENLDKIGKYLAEHASGYLFAAPLRTISGEVFCEDDRGGFYRMFPFVRGSRTYDVVDSPEKAYEASRQFGLFTCALRDFEVSQL